MAGAAPGGAGKLARAFSPGSPDRPSACSSGAMPSTHSTKDRPPRPEAEQPKPTPRQMRYLRDLANRLGQTFTYPATRRHAAAEIDRLKQLARGRERLLDRDTARRERLATSRDLAENFGGASAVRPDEVSGFGSSATWSQRS